MRKSTLKRKLRVARLEITALQRDRARMRDENYRMRMALEGTPRASSVPDLVRMVENHELHARIASKEEHIAFLSHQLGSANRKLREAGIEP